MTFLILCTCDTDKYFENIQTILIFLKYYCYVSHLEYHKIIFFFMNNYWGEIFFISRFNQTSLKETWNKKVFRLCNLLNYIVLTSKLLLQKKLACNILWKHSQKKRNVILEIISCDFHDNKFFKMDPIPRIYQQHFWITWTKGRRKTKGITS